jgi:hypothetical protein
MFAILLPSKGYLMADYYYSDVARKARRFSRRFEAEKTISLLSLKDALIVVMGA